MSKTNPPKALLFDVFGTVVDWRTTVTQHLTARCKSALASPTSLMPAAVHDRASSLTEDDWATIAQEWRDSYAEFTSKHDPTRGFVTVDDHHHDNLNQLLKERDLTGLWTASEVQEISRIWHFLKPWPDSSAGLAQFNKKFVTSTLSNGNISLLTDMAAYAHLPWAHILSSEHFKAYKPSPLVYNGAAEKLGLQTTDCALVAAHLGDLKAAKGCGYQAIYVERKGEEIWSAEEIERARIEGWVDMWVDLGDAEAGFLEVARRFGITQ
ncbi:MAG: hypothetical protein M1812_004749 [Candelaria pacifica]|nr:MAG: hypothetical protein M1812_004749 [Candelaria pacifica]